MNRTLLTALAAALLIPLSDSTAGIIHVPADFPTIQAGIDSSSDGDTVIVAPGTYPENINFHGRKIVLASNYLFSGDQADIGSTVIDGSQPADPDTASCVLFIGGEDSTTVLEGFTLTGGSGTVWRDIHNGNLYREGGGILVEFSSPVIRNNVIVHNDATGPGGTSAGGGGIRSGDANPTIAGNVIAYNAGKYGGGIVLNYSAARIHHNIIYRNSGGEDFGGSGVWIFAPGSGAWSGPRIIENNTIMENASSSYGGGVYIGNTSATFRNNIIRENTAPESPQISQQGGAMTVRYSNVQGGWPGLGNIDAEPGIGDTTHRLEPGSPCIDAGDPAPAYDDPEDGGSPGTALYPSMGGLRNDMGAFGGPGRGLVYLRIHRDAPQAPSGPSAYSDYLTPASIVLSWTDPSELFNGDPIPGFAIRLYRDSVYLATVAPATESFTDTGLVLHRLYRYRLVAVTSVDSSPVVEASAYAGGAAAPAGPAGLRPFDGSPGSTIGWLTPSRQVDGTPLNDLAMAYIHRDGVLRDSVPLQASDTGSWKTYTDTAAGYHWYRIVLRDGETPWHFSAFTDSVLGYGGLAGSYHEDFESGTGAIYRTGAWDTTSAHAHGPGRCLTDSPGGNPGIVTTSYVLLPPVRLDGLCALEYQNIAIVRGGSFANVEVSTDGRNTFKPVKLYNSFFSPKWQDASADSADWIRFVIDLSAYEGDTVTVRFKLQNGTLAPWDGWYIDDVSIGRVDPDSFHALGVYPGWTMLSLPVAAGGRIDSVLGGEASTVWRYDGAYVRTDSIVPGGGYWAKFDTGAAPVVTGSLIPADTLTLRAKWNMIGSIGYPLDSSAVRTQPPGIIQSPFFWYDPDSGYVPSRELLPGRAYWVRLSAAGKMILSHFYPSVPPAQLPADPAAAAAGELTITDAAGRSATLLFAGADESAIPREMPPPPPSGAFDVRFGDGLGLARPDAGGPKEVPVLVGGARFPLTARWSARRDAGVAATLILNGVPVPLEGRGERTIESLSGPPSLRLSPRGAAGPPSRFTLEGNFPNPFNPSTTISFALPAAQFVSLRVFDLLGREVTELAGMVLGPGSHRLTWDASSSAAGVYVYRLTAGDASALGRMLLVK